MSRKNGVMAGVELVLELVLFLVHPFRAPRCHNDGMIEAAQVLAGGFCWRRSTRAMLACACLALASLAPGAQAATPSTFAPVIGSALLCRSHLENNYFYSYLTQNFGKPYRHAGGAYWFRLDAVLWGEKVTEVMVSDDTSEVVFIAAVVETTPDKLAKAAQAASGKAYRVADRSRYPLRISMTGSTIAYAREKSKIYCIRFKPQPPGP